VPPPTATVSEVSSSPQAAGGLVGGVLSGGGWASVYRLPAGPRRAGAGSVAGDAFENVPRVSGQWGKGRLLESPLLSMLVTKDGRVYAGAVSPSRLYAVAAAGGKRNSNK
jgi:hypothetical protein